MINTCCHGNNKPGNGYLIKQYISQLIIIGVQFCMILYGQILCAFAETRIYTRSWDHK